MKQQIKKIVFLSMIFTMFFFGACSMMPPTLLEIDAFNEISDIATFQGNPESNIVVVNSQGGPMTELEDGLLRDFISETKAQSVLFVNVHQAQTQNPAQFTDADITFEQAKQYDAQSIANLKRVIDFFKGQQGKKVYVLGISFGAFTTQELIAVHGIDVADGYLIIVGRLDIDEDIWQPFSQGIYTGYVYDDIGNYTIEPLEDDFSISDRNMARLAAGLGYNRYTDELDPISDLSKITYVYGDRDEQVGPLSPSEIQFLEGKNAHVISVSGNHDDAIAIGLSHLKQTFGIP
ncbi:hypothetical protein [Candidatus Leptofilum sp.]|uniref:hypothetical protein n=1 Tax=Candidatus Leptofilum sp. TaxID=3241576 RepID=UPI003B5CA03F